MRPVGKKILVEIIEEQKETPGGIVLPDQTSSDQPSKGSVLAIGDEVDEGNIPLDSVVFFPKYSGTPLEIAGHQCAIVELEKVLLVHDSKLPELGKPIEGMDLCDND